MDDTAIGRVRRFQRTVTQRIGALNDGFLARGRALGQARVLWEIGAEGSEIRALRARLELDSGYMSRLLRSLEADGLVVVDGAGPDGRVRTARRTAVVAQETPAELDFTVGEVVLMGRTPYRRVPAADEERCTRALDRVG
ncbi:MarR family transcriptional regulator, partial [Nonomuraea fuscirosea]